MAENTSEAGTRRATLRIDAGADRGMAIGRLDGKAIFVPFAAPGDLLHVELVKEKPRYAEARIVEILESSPVRRKPPCPHFGACGGCQWQHVAYASQLESKAEAFQGLLRSRLGLDPGLFLPPIAAPEEWGYRNRVGLKVRCMAGKVGLGYFRRGSHRIVDLQDCPIARREIRDLIAPLHAFVGDFPGAEALPQVDVQADGEGGLWAIFHGVRPFRRAEAAALRAFAKAQGLAGAHVQLGRKSTLEPLISCPDRMAFSAQAGGRSFRLALTPGGFLQANDRVNDALVAQVVDLADLYAGVPALDLFCGAGNFTLPLALAAREVVGAEAYGPAARDAVHNARSNQLGNVRIYSEPAEAALQRLAAQGFRPRFALLDPPREGASEAVPPLAALGPDHVLYISCAPATLVRDLGLFHGHGYRVTWTRAADMFPQTAHVESVTLLRRAGSASPPDRRRLAANPSSARVVDTP